MLASVNGPADAILYKTLGVLKCVRPDELLRAGLGKSCPELHMPSVDLASACTLKFIEYSPASL